MPTMDRLAQSELTYTPWHTTARCAPTRSTLLTDRNTYYPNTTDVAEQTAANITNVSYKIFGEVEFDHSEGDVFAQGSRFGGHSLFVKDGKLNYVYNFLGIPPEQKLVVDAPISGSHVVDIEFVKERVDELGEGPARVVSKSTRWAEGTLIMLSVIGDFLGFAIGIALSPMAIVGFILMLVSAGGLVKAWGFIGGWAVGTAVVLVLVGLLVSTSADDDGSGTNTAVAWIKIVLGGLMVALAWHQFQGRPRDGQPATLPKWMGALDSFTPVKAFGLGAMLGTLNPKNLPLLISSAGVIGQAGLSGGEEVVVYVVFIVLACLGMLIPIGIFLAAGDKGAAILDEVREWLVANNAVIMAVLFLVLGVSMLGKGLGGL